MKNKNVIFGLAAVFILLGGYFLYEHIMYVDTDNAQVDAHTVMIAARVNGYIKEVKVTEGQKVKKGETMIVIDNRDYQSMANSARSELASLQARKIDAEKNYARVRSLYSESVVSSQQFDAATATYNEIKAKYDSAEAKLVQAELNLENTDIKAPADGIVARKSAELGQLAVPGAPLIGFVSSESRWVTANFKETDISNIKVGSKVNIDIDAISGKSYEGVVETISPATGAMFTLLPPDNATGNFTKVVQRVPVKIKFSQLSESDYDQIQAGLSAVVKVHKH